MKSGSVQGRLFQRDECTVRHCVSSSRRFNRCGDSGEAVARRGGAHCRQGRDGDPEVREEEADADVFVRAGDRASMSGLIGAGAGILLWVLSRVKGNRWTPVLPAVLVVAWAMSWLLMV